MKVTEHPVPKMAKHASQVNPRAFSLECDDGAIIGVIHSKEPANRDGTLAIHCSVSKSRWATAMPVSSDDLKEVEQAMLNRGLEWPAELDLLPFTAGPFAGKGIHVWQKYPSAECASK